MKQLADLKPLIPYIGKYKRGIFLGMVFILILNTFSTLVPKSIGWAFDSLEEPFSRGLLLKYIGYIFILSLFAGFFRFLMRYVMIGISRKIEFDLRNDYFRHLQSLSQVFFNVTKTGDLMSRATNDLNAVRMVLGPGIMYSINTLMLFCFALTYMIKINAALTLIALTPFPFLAVLINRVGARVHFWFEKIQAQMSSISARAQENISGIRIIKAYIREKSETDSFKSLNRDYVSLNKRLIKIQSIFFPLIQMISGIGFALILLYGGRSVISGSISIGDFVAFNTYLMMLLWPVIATGWLVNIFQRGAASMRRINRIMEAQPSVEDANADNSITGIDGSIEIRDLTFSYGENGHTVLKNISLSIPKNSTIALIGPTGSGKSTLVNLLPRLYDPPPGTVFLDGHDIRTIPLALLRKSIGYVPQETFLFSDTIKENIAYGLDHFTDMQLFEAVEISQLRDNIESFPHRFETILGERGINLSGGQKQRTAISRALIREPKILILDDALSSVDTKTEEEILSRLRGIFRTRTCIIISHRVSTIKDADNIYVIDDGMIIEEGSHEELLKADGLYAGLYRKQLLSEELELE
ncbi:ABC transporter ATP-binding protein [candidate division KSB1 bacterium]